MRNPRRTYCLVAPRKSHHLSGIHVTNAPPLDERCYDGTTLNEKKRKKRSDVKHILHPSNTLKIQKKKTDVNVLEKSDDIGWTRKRCR